MSASSSLLQDTLSFLAFLHTRDVRPMGGRWLTPSALRDLNAGLIVHDSLQPPARGRGGKRGTVERDTDRLRFIHFLCEAAHLVTKTGLYLKPTLRVPRWLAASPRDQLRTLFDAAYPAQPHRPHDELWRTYRLPGCTLSSPTLSLAPLFDILRRMAFTERLRLTTLLRLVPLPDDPARSETPDAILRGVLDQLAAFEVLIWRGQSIVQLTDLGAHLLNRPDALPSPREAHRMLVPVLGEGLGVRVELTGMKIDLPQPTFSQLYELANYAELISPNPVRRAGVTRRYRLDRDRIQRALQRGLTLDGLLRFFETLLGDALPHQLHRQLRDWAAQLDQLTIRRVALLEVRDPATLTDLTRSHRVRESLGRALSPRAVIIRPSRLAPLVRQLKKRGLAPRLYFSTTPSINYRTTELTHYDTPVIAQLYYAALLNHQLADRLPAPYRVDYSVVLDLERQLTPHDRDLAQSLATEAAQILMNDGRPSMAVAELATPALRPQRGAVQMSTRSANGSKV